MKIKYPCEQTISVWVGTFSSENDFDNSVDNNVTKRLELKIPIESICEISFELDSVPLRKLIEGFSGWETFIDEAEGAGKKYGCERGNAALVCYYLECNDAPTMWGDLCFLGSFTGQDVR